MTDINKEDIHRRLRWPNHIFRRSDELHNRMIQFITSPSIARLVPTLVPIKELGYLVRHVAHAAPPTCENLDQASGDDNRDAPVSTINELNVWVDISSATSATGDHSVCHQWDRLFAFFDSTVRCDHKRKWYLRLVEKRRRCRDSIQSRPLVAVIRVRVRGRSDARIGRQPNFWRRTG